MGGRLANWWWFSLRDQLRSGDRRGFEGRDSVDCCSGFLQENIDMVKIAGKRIIVIGIIGIILAGCQKSWLSRAERRDLEVQYCYDEAKNDVEFYAGLISLIEAGDIDAVKKVLTMVQFLELQTLYGLTDQERRSQFGEPFVPVRLGPFRNSAKCYAREKRALSAIFHYKNSNPGYSGRWILELVCGNIRFNRKLHPSNWK